MAASLAWIRSAPGGQDDRVHVAPEHRELGQRVRQVQRGQGVLRDQQLAGAADVRDRLVADAADEDRQQHAQADEPEELLRETEVVEDLHGSSFDGPAPPLDR